MNKKKSENETIGMFLLESGKNLSDCFLLCYKKKYVK